MTSPLFKPLQLGAISLSHRVVMAPLTRLRAAAPDNVPTELSVEYYRQRLNRRFDHLGGFSSLANWPRLSDHSWHSFRCSSCRMEKSGRAGSRPRRQDHFAALACRSCVASVPSAWLRIACRAIGCGGCWDRVDRRLETGAIRGSARTRNG